MSDFGPTSEGRTERAMRDGAAVIYQGVFVDDDWHGLCEYQPACARQWQEDDHLSLVANIRRDQGGAAERGRRGDDGGIGARYELLLIDERTGFRLLPQPSEGDIFFDMEGDPYYSDFVESGFSRDLVGSGFSRTSFSGLEYLFGVMTVDDGTPRFEAIQALDRRWGGRPPGEPLAIARNAVSGSHGGVESARCHQAEWE